MSAAPALFSDGPVAGGIEGSRLFAALALSLGIHAGVALFVDVPGHTEFPAKAGTVQVRLVHSSARSALAPVATGESVLPALVPVAVSAAIPAERPAVMPLIPGSIVPAVSARPAPLSPTPVPPARAVTERPGKVVKAIQSPVPRKSVFVKKVPRKESASRASRKSREKKSVPAEAVADSPRAPGPDPRMEDAARSTVASAAPAARSRASVSPPAPRPARPLADNPRPRYPMLARRRGQEGSVLVRLDVDARGTPSSVRVISSSGVASLDEAAREAVSRWRFEPARRRGEAEPATVDVPVEFRLDGNG